MDATGRTTATRAQPTRALVAEARQHAGLKVGTLARLVAAHLGEPDRIEAHRVRLHRFETGEAASLPAHVYSALADVLLDRLREDDDGYRLGSLLHADRMAANLRADLARFERLIRSRQENVDAAVAELVRFEGMAATRREAADAARAALSEMQSARDRTRRLLVEMERS